MKIENVKVKSTIDENYFSVDSDDNIREVLSKIRDEDVFAVPVMEDEELKGIITWRKILQRSASPKTKVKKLLIHSPTIDAEMNLVEVAEKMLETGSRACPVYENGNFIGTITQAEIIDAVSKDESFGDKKIEDMSLELVTITESETIGRAKALMRENRIARLPVVDKDGKLIGSVDLSGLVKTFNPEKAMQVGERKGESLPERDSPVTGIMNRSPLAMSCGSSLKEAAKKMSKKNSLYAIAVEEDKPVAIVTPKDIMELVASKIEEKGAYIQLAGVKDFDNFARDKMLDMAERKVKKAGRMFDDVQSLIVHMKSQNREGKNAQYSTHARLFTSDGLFTAKQDWEWEAAEAVNKCLEKLEKRFTKHHEKKVERRREGG
ncbi:MAG: CBS domain-containing protein [Candidatus Aenigmatarchaeota archaeon]